MTRRGSAALSRTATMSAKKAKAPEAQCRAPFFFPADAGILFFIEVIGIQLFCAFRTNAMREFGLRML